MDKRIKEIENKIWDEENTNSAIEANNNSAIRANELLSQKRKKEEELRVGIVGEQRKSSGIKPGV